MGFRPLFIWRSLPSSFHGDADELQDSLQLVIAEEPDIQRAFALTIAHVDLGAESFAQFVFQVGDVNIAQEEASGSAGSGGGSVFPLPLELRDQPFGLPDVEP